MNDLRNHEIGIIRRIITLLRRQEEEIPVVGKDRVLQSIKQKISADRVLRQRRFWLRTSCSVAACIALLIGIGWFYHDDESKQDSVLAEMIQQMKKQNKELSQEEVVLQLSGQENITLNDEDKVSYLTSGAVSVNHKIISQNSQNTAETENVEYNKLIVPLGKRAQISLADGTRMWVNSGSYVVYPVAFNQKNREIFVDGEVYLDVAHDASHPFIVKTEKFSVRVLGTSFNVFAYGSEDRASVVLAKGRVDVTDQNQGKVNLSPGQITQIQNGAASDPVCTDIEKYICWIDNQLIIDDLPMSTVLNKLRLYYGKQFVSTPKVDALIASGKLELKNSFTGIMRTIVYSLPIKYKESGNTVYLTYDDGR